MKLTRRQRELLLAVASQCPTYECEGGCNLGWYEPIEGRTLIVARRLDVMELLNLTNGAHPRWIAAHVTKAGRYILNSTSNRVGAGFIKL